MAMGIFGGLETAFLKGNQAKGKIQGAYSSAKGAKALSQAKSIGNSLAKDMKTGGAAMRMAATGAVGGAAGYASSDGDAGSTLKGFGLGVAGGAAWTASKNPLLRAGVKDAYAGSKGYMKQGMGKVEEGLSKVGDKISSLANGERDARASKMANKFINSVKPKGAGPRNSFMNGRMGGGVGMKMPSWGS